MITRDLANLVPKPAASPVIEVFFNKNIRRRLPVLQLSGSCERMSELNEERCISFLSRKQLGEAHAVYASPIYSHERMASALLKAAGVRLPNVSKGKAGCIDPSPLAKSLALVVLCGSPRRLAQAELCTLPSLGLSTYREERPPD